MWLKWLDSCGQRETIYVRVGNRNVPRWAPQLLQWWCQTSVPASSLSPALHIRSEWWCRLVWASRLYCVMRGLTVSDLPLPLTVRPRPAGPLDFPQPHIAFLINTLVRINYTSTSGLVSLRWFQLPDLVRHHRCSSCGTYRGTLRFLTLTYIVSLCPQLSGHFNHIMSVSHPNWRPFPDLRTSPATCVMQSLTDMRLISGVFLPSFVIGASSPVPRHQHMLVVGFLGAGTV